VVTLGEEDLKAGKPGLALPYLPRGQATIQKQFPEAWTLVASLTGQSRLNRDTDRALPGAQT
jgi:hypothetical protein